ncbi:hypothetical protein SAMN05428976_11516 [Clostridium sp. USBA 49]|uniref:DUF5305 family protein n=1 Tax=Clostridium sp. USBA 49 TaxID=1881060 RepID=UPI000999F3AF|nr:DUF5305 family protein [Clostridium sp. USBA 49]SKA90798.1 hypothetical protein SAMN05428976_11516 [Clostridium sp. USBA 49]
MNKVNLDKNNRKILLFTCVFVFMFGFLFLLKTLISGKYENKKEEVLSYNNKALINYKVNLLPNSIYEEKSLGEGKIYITDYVDSIDTLLNYKFNCKDNIEKISVDYEVNAVIEGFIGNKKDSKEIWSKKFNLQPKTELVLNKNEFQKDILIDIKNYNSIVRDMVKKVNTNFSNKLIVTWNINVKGKSSKGEFFEKLSPTMEIPLGESYFEVKGDLLQDKNGSIDNVKKVISDRYITGIIISSFTMVISIIAFFYIFLFTLENDNKEISIRKINKILKNYEDMLVALKDEPLEGNEIIIKVLDMNGLIKIADDLDKPIFYKYFININEIKYFCVIDNKKAYVYQI